jgi:hypothetical protein
LVAVPYEGTEFYYRAAQELLFWQAPDGLCYQLTQAHEFDQLLRRLRLQKTVQQFQPDYTSNTLTSGLPQPLQLLKDLG